MRQMIIRRGLLISLFLGVVWFLGACAPANLLPVGPTSIPTLIPATAPARSVGPTEVPAFAVLSFPARPPSAEAGQPLYLTHCAECHGEDGVGVVPGARNFNDLDYMRGESPSFFYAAVTEGRGEMPSFKDVLTSDERWDVVFYVWRFSTNTETLALGEQIYAANCVACHGEGGTGEVLGAADFTDLRLVADQAPRDFYLIVTQGQGSMPAWQGRLSQEERWAVIDYIRTFSYDPQLPGEQAAISEPTPTSEENVCDPYLSQSNPFAWDDAQAISSGELIYDQSCSMCHGEDGSGGLPGAPDFTNPQVSAEIRSDSAEHLCVIAEGRGNMPGWKETLTNEQMWQALTYIDSFSK